MKKILLLTGASSDVGMSLLAEIFADYETIYLQYRNMNERLKKLIDTIGKKTKVCPLQADFRDVNSINSMIYSIIENGDLPNNIVHFPAAKAYNMQFHKDNWENYNTGWQISVRSIVLVLQAFIKNMAKERYGRIVFMLTSYTNNLPARYQTSYVTVKYALLGLMKSLSVEYADKGITVNGVSPDMMETKFLSELPDLIVETNREGSPIGRNIYVNEIIPIFKYMLSDLGASITGQNIAITGGL
ncbi:MAG: SDR family oxidoreductase [Synergistaceae bacterium]|nr:SDR family oxidoreductase [Synergistaceae bacterium]